MKIDVLTLFPGMIEPVIAQSIIGRAREKGQVEINIHDYTILFIFILNKMFNSEKVMFQK